MTALNVHKAWTCLRKKLKEEELFGMVAQQLIESEARGCAA